MRAAGCGRATACRRHLALPLRPEAAPSCFQPLSDHGYHLDDFEDGRRHCHPHLAPPLSPGPCLPPLAPRSYYLNNFEDGHKQDALDLVAGAYAVVPGEGTSHCSRAPPAWWGQRAVHLCPPQPA